MNVQELEKWVTETPEGQQWLEGHKKPLLDKRDELLEKVKTGNASIEQLNQRLASLESDLSKEQGINKEVLLSRPLAEKLKEKGVFPVLVPELVKTLSETYGLHIQDGNAAGMLKVDGKETALTIDQAIEHWSASDKAKDCFKPMDIKTTSTSPDFKTGGAGGDHVDAIMRKAAGLTPKTE
jgi:DNA repair exonuclease SbcCD ATPase subunit